MSFVHANGLVMHSLRPRSSAYRVMMCSDDKPTYHAQTRLHGPNSSLSCLGLYEAWTTDCSIQVTAAAGF